MQAAVAFQPLQEIGGPVEDFSLTGIGGERIALSSLLEGRRGGVVVFWSGVCSHCVRYDGYLNRFSERHPELGLAVIASRSGETPEQIGRTMQDRGIAFPIAYDSGSIVARQWSTEQTPRAFLIDPQGKLLYRGAIDNFKYPGDPEYVAYLENAIEQFLNGLPIRRTETQSFGCAIASVYYTLPTQFPKRQ